MPIPTRGLREQHVGKRLRIELTVCQEAEPCRGVTYRLLCANHHDQSKKEGLVYWVGSAGIESFQALGERLT